MVGSEQRSVTEEGKLKEGRLLYMSRREEKLRIRERGRRYHKKSKTNQKKSKAG